MRDGYSGPESRFRDRDGREHYNDGRYAPMNRGGEYSGDPMGRGGYGYPRSAYYVVRIAALHIWSPILTIP